MSFLFVFALAVSDYIKNVLKSRYSAFYRQQLNDLLYFPCPLTHVSVVQHSLFLRWTHMDTSSCQNEKQLTAWR